MMKREESMGAAFLSVRGVVRDPTTTEKNPGGLLAITTTTFSRSHVDSPIAMPEKAKFRPNDQIGEEALQHSRIVPRPFSQIPFSSALSAGSNTPDEGVVNHVFRDSFLSIGSGQNRFSVSSNGSISSQGLAIGTKRKVRQLFNPVLPDELLISTPGEQLILMQSFDDGWCLVGRESCLFASTAQSIFRQNQTPDNNLELGVVPAWCFIKPVKGLRVERPVRSSSLGITVQLQAPAFSSRDEVVSWSNF